MNNKEFVLPDFIPVFKETRLDENLTPLDRLVHGAIYWYEQLKDGRCFASNESIAHVVGATEKSVANSIQRLTKFGYLKCEFFDESKRNRSQIRFIRKQVDTLDNVSDTLVDVSRDTLVDVQRKNNINNNIKGEYLISIPEDDIQTFMKKYRATRSEITIKGEALYTWCKSKGKKYKDYRMFLMNALLRDFGLRIDNRGTAL